jgi:hypothetical protein
MAALLAIAALDLLSTELRLAASRRLGVTDGVAFTMLNRLFALTILPLPLTWAAIILASIPVSRIAWVHVRYEVDHNGRVIRIERDSVGPPAASEMAVNCLHPAESS